jgi:membrane-associated protein
VPIVRTLITAMAGMGRMDRKTFIVNSAIGAVAWVIGITLLGAGLGSNEFVRANLEIILLSFVGLSVLPIAIEIYRHRKLSK